MDRKVDDLSKILLPSRVYVTRLSLLGVCSRQIVMMEGTSGLVVCSWASPFLASAILRSSFASEAAPSQYSNPLYVDHLNSTSRSLKPYSYDPYLTLLWTLATRLTFCPIVSPNR